MGSNSRGRPHHNTRKDVIEICSLLGARLKSYVLGTLIGAIAPTILYANLGAGLGELVDAGLSPGWSDLLRPSFLAVLAMALILAIFPFVRQRWQNARR